MALLTKETELRNYVSVGLALKIKTLGPAIHDVEQKEVLPLLGRSLFDSLNAAYNNGAPADPAAAPLALLPYTQRIIANLALADTMDVSQVSITEAGITRLEREDEKSAYHYQKIEAQQYFKRIGYNAQEDLLSYLEENLTTYPGWKNSEAYKAAKRFFISSATDFSHYYNINNSRLTFRSMLYLMERAEQFQIKDVIGADLFTEIKTQLQADTLSDANKKLLDYIKPALAYLTIADAALELSLTVTPQGLLLTQIAGGGSSQESKAPEEAKLEKLRGRAEAAGQRYLNELRKYLLKTASDTVYPLFYNSDLYPKTTNSSPERGEEPPANNRIYGAF